MKTQAQLFSILIKYSGTMIAVLTFMGPLTAHAQLIPVVTRTPLVQKNDLIAGSAIIKVTVPGVPCIERTGGLRPAVALKASLSNGRTAVGIYNPVLDAFEVMVKTTDTFPVDDGDGLGPRMATLTGFSDPWINRLFEMGRLYFIGTFAGAGATTATNQALFYIDFTHDPLGALTLGSLTLVQRRGWPLPDQDYLTNTRYRLLNFTSVVAGWDWGDAFSGTLIHDHPIGEVPITTANDLGLWINGRLVLREGTLNANVFPAEGGGPVSRTVKTFSALASGALGRGQGNGLGFDSYVVARIEWTDGKSGIYSVGHTGNVDEVAKKDGGQAPGYPAGARFSLFGIPSEAPNNGTLVFKAAQKVVPGLVPAANANALFVGWGFLPDLRRVAVQGSTFEAGPTATTQLSTFNDPIVADNGSVLWTGTMKDAPAIPASQDTGLWSCSFINHLFSHGQPTLEAQEGFQPPGLDPLGPPGTIKSFTAALANPATFSWDYEVFAFESYLNVTGGTTLANDQGVWAGDTRDLDAVHVELIREGVTEIDGKIVKSFRAFPGMVPTSAVRRNVNDTSDFVFLVTFMDYTSGVVLFEVNAW